MAARLHASARQWSHSAGLGTEIIYCEEKLEIPPNLLNSASFLKVDLVFDRQARPRVILTSRALTGPAVGVPHKPSYWDLPADVQTLLVELQLVDLRLQVEVAVLVAVAVAHRHWVEVAVLAAVVVRRCECECGGGGGGGGGEGGESSAASLSQRVWWYAASSRTHTLPRKSNQWQRPKQPHFDGSLHPGRMGRYPKW